MLDAVLSLEGEKIVDHRSRIEQPSSVRAESRMIKLKLVEAYILFGSQ
jgi:hypothetical protein